MLLNKPAKAVDGFPKVARKLLSASAKFWFGVMLIGQWFFVYYLLLYYGKPVFSQGLEALADTRLPQGYIEGDMIGNLAVAAHLFSAVVILGGGPLQLVPKIRALFPVFHRWLGRTYVVTAILTSFAGLYMVWGRGDAGVGNLA